MLLLKKTPFGGFLLSALLSCSFSLHAQKDTIVVPHAQSDTIGIKVRHNTLVFPIIVRSIETGWSFGAAGSKTFHLKSRDTTTLTRTSNMQALALYTVHQQFVAAINGSIYFPGEKFILNQQLSYSSFPDEFWGLGKVAPDSNKEDYKFKQYYVYLHPQRRVGNNLFVGVVYQFQRVLDVKYQAGGLFDKENVLGRYGYSISGLGLSFTYDTRNNAFAPDRGSMFQFYFDHFAPYFGSDYHYTNYVIDLRKFIRLYAQQVLALQFYGFFNAGEVPLRSLATIGGSNSMRGYYAGRFRDKNETVLQAEYRFPLFWRFGAVAFGDLGNVSGELSNDYLYHLKYSYGSGLRFGLDKTERLNLRLDYGIGRGHSQGFYFQLGEAF